jgi:GDPmannose 4,6-dehydratase
VPTLITGVSGQDGSYLAELLARNQQRIVATVHPHAEIPPYVDLLQARGTLSLIACDIGDTSAFRHLLRETQPDRVFHLAAITTTRETTSDVELSRRINVDSVEALADWAKRDAPYARVLVSSSAAIFGASSLPQNEDTQCKPADEYGRQKLRVREIAADARQRGVFMACAIPFNHESPRRDERFVFAKICYGAARVARGLQDVLVLGNMDVRRDWGFAPEFCEAFAEMLNTEKAHELVLATGEAHSVQELVQAAFSRAGVADWEHHVDSDILLHRSADFDLHGDAAQAHKVLGWTARTRFNQLVELMVDSALAVES